MKEKTVTDLKKNMEMILSKIEDDGEPVIITRRGTARFVIMDMSSFDHLRSANSFLKMLAKTEESNDGELHIR